MKLTTKIVIWPLRQPFTIARDTWTSITCIQVTLTDAQGNIGRGDRFRCFIGPRVFYD